MKIERRQKQPFIDLEVPTRFKEKELHQDDWAPLNAEFAQLRQIILYPEGLSDVSQRQAIDTLLSYLRNVLIMDTGDKLRIDQGFRADLNDSSKVCAIAREYWLKILQSDEISPNDYYFLKEFALLVNFSPDSVAIYPEFMEGTCEERLNGFANLVISHAIDPSVGTDHLDALNFIYKVVQALPAYNYEYILDWMPLIINFIEALQQKFPDLSQAHSEGRISDELDCLITYLLNFIARIENSSSHDLLTIEFCWMWDSSIYVNSHIIKKAVRALQKGAKSFVKTLGSELKKRYDIQVETLKDRFKDEKENADESDE